MLKRSIVGSSVVLVGAGVLVGGGALAVRRRMAKKRLSAGSGLVVPLRPAEGNLAVDAGPLVGDDRLDVVAGFAQAVGRRGGKTSELRQVAMAAAGNGSRVGVVGSGGYAELDNNQPGSWDDVVAMVGSGLDGVAPFGEPAFRQPEFRSPETSSRRWRPARVSDGIVCDWGPPIGEPISEESPMAVTSRPRRSNYRLKRARQWVTDRAKEDERWERFMGHRTADARVAPSTLSTTEVEHHDELAQLGQVEMEIFQDGRPSGEHPSIGRGRRFVMWFRTNVLGDK